VISLDVSNCLFVCFRLLTEDIHPDLAVETVIDRLSCHGSVIRARSEGLYEVLLTHNSDATNVQEHVIDLRHLSEPDQRVVLQCLR